MPNTFWWLLNFERYVHVYLSFRCIFLICSCHLNNHPSILWTILYPSPDDGYYNRNVNVDFTSWYIHLFGLYFFLLPSYIYIYIYICVCVCVVKIFFKKSTLYTCKQPLMIAYEWFESTQDNFSKFIYQFQPKTKTLVWKPEIL